MMGLVRDRRGLDQTVGQLLVLMVMMSAITFALVAVNPLLDQFTSRNRIREAEALMTSLYNEIMKVTEEPAGSSRSVELEIKHGGIDLFNSPPRMVYYFRVPKEVYADVTGMEFAYTSQGAMLAANLTLPFERRYFIGPGSNVVRITKIDGGILNVTVETY